VLAQAFEVARQGLAGLAGLAGPAG